MPGLSPAPVTLPRLSWGDPSSESRALLAAVQPLLQEDGIALRYVRPDYVHVFLDGRIVDEGGPALADAIEADGYASYTPAVAST